jgi:hypothetical protein
MLGEPEASLSNPIRILCHSHLTTKNDPLESQYDHSVCVCVKGVARMDESACDGDVCLMVNEMSEFERFLSLEIIYCGVAGEFPQK